jgi:hypothetical protein
MNESEQGRSGLRCVVRITERFVKNTSLRRAPPGDFITISAHRPLDRLAIQDAILGRLGRGTRLDIKMSYSPAAGVFGHVVAKLFGADPKTELDEDLLRMKIFLETGKAPRDAAAHA